MEKKTSKKTNTKAKKGVKKVEEKTNITLDEINLDTDTVTKGNIVINENEIKLTANPTEPTETGYEEIVHNNTVSIIKIQNKIAELKEQRNKATGTLRIYTVQDSYNFQIQVLEGFLKEVK